MASQDDISYDMSGNSESMGLTPLSKNSPKKSVMFDKSSDKLGSKRDLSGEKSLDKSPDKSGDKS
jgi:hypothetical protein